MKNPYPIRILYAGRFSFGNDAETIMYALARLNADPRFSFTFAGSGPRWNALSNVCRLFAPRVKFLPVVDTGPIREAIAACDIGLVTQCAVQGSVDKTIVRAFIAASRPILFIGPRNSSTARLIKRTRCGWQIEPGDTQTLMRFFYGCSAHAQELRDAA
jgi:hypothetical protein